MVRSVFTGLLCFVTLACPATAGISPPPPEAGPAQVTSRLVNGQLEVRDVRDNFGIIVPQGLKIAHRFPAGIVSSVQLQSQPTGADLIIKITNTTSRPQRPGKLTVGIMNLGQQVQYFDFRNEAEPVAADYATYTGQAFIYPSDLYSPVAVIRNASYAIGVSVQYPVLEYRHDVQVGVSSPPSTFAIGEAGRGWSADIGIANLGDESAHGRIQYEGVLNGGQSRTYVMSVRISRDPDDWIRTLLPYRDYFRSQYGGVTYNRDPTPILGVAASDQAYLSASNPRGFPLHLRQDLNGWGAFVDMLNQVPGWNAYVIWTPSGLYYRNRALNFPYQFASPFAKDPELATAFDPVRGLASIPASGRKLGFWWGRSLEVATTWDPEIMENFDSDDPRHVAAAHAEMDAAVRTGATIVGLDTFNPNRTPIWKLYPWLRHMRERYPQVKFCTEPSQSDLLHTLAATAFQGWRDGIVPTTEADILTVRTPNYLADLILPGHETWLTFSYHLHKQYLGGVPPDARVLQQMQEYAAMGYRPVFFSMAPLPVPVVSAPSWESTLPVDIIANDPAIAELRAQPPGDAGGAQRLEPQAPSANSYFRSWWRSSRMNSNVRQWTMTRVIPPSPPPENSLGVPAQRNAGTAVQHPPAPRPTQRVTTPSTTGRNIGDILKRLRAVQRSRNPDTVNP